MNEAINGDLSRRVMVDTRRLDWTPSPGRSVWRKRVHLVGAPESGQVTSVVRYEPDAAFPAHDHPEGEEILVLDGVFSDEHGDWPAGTYLLNPEGFRHAPFSKPGCVLFVKLRQFPGRGREHVCIDTTGLAWEPGEVDGSSCALLYGQDGFTDRTRLERWDPGVAPGPRTYAQGVELFVLEGAFHDAEGSYGEGCWLRLPPGASHEPASATGCRLYVKTGGFRYLRSATG
jgi:anti-sigma factor ChrR (cupin superfamily)